MQRTPVDFAEKLGQFAEHRSPTIVAGCGTLNTGDAATAAVKARI